MLQYRQILHVTHSPQVQDTVVEKMISFPLIFFCQCGIPLMRPFQGIFLQSCFYMCMCLQMEILRWKRRKKRNCTLSRMIILDQNATTTKRSPSLTTSRLKTNSGKSYGCLSSVFNCMWSQKLQLLSTNGFRLSWAEERKRNLETFGVPGRFLRGQGFRGGYPGRRGRGSAQTLPPYRARGGQL